LPSRGFDVDQSIEDELLAHVFIGNLSLKRRQETKNVCALLNIKNQSGITVAYLIHINVVSCKKTKVALVLMPTHQGQRPRLQELRQLPRPDSLPVRQVGFGAGVRKKSQ
jgi:hypothetical protein